MTLPLTAALASLFAALMIVCAVMGARPSTPLRPPRLVPWRLLMLFAFAAMVAMLVHVVSLLKGR
ncbi:MAG: hypothetical protein ACYC8V_03600 [Caulobacteraceae bacterium]